MTTYRVRVVVRDDTLTAELSDLGDVIVARDHRVLPDLLLNRVASRTGESLSEIELSFEVEQAPIADDPTAGVSNQPEAGRERLRIKLVCDGPGCGRHIGSVFADEDGLLVLKPRMALSGGAEMSPHIEVRGDWSVLHCVDHGYVIPTAETAEERAVVLRRRAAVEAHFVRLGRSEKVATRRVRCGPVGLDWS